jgi:hypothetical protein
VISYSKKFEATRVRVKKLEEKLETERSKLQKLCPHVHLNGSSAFPHGTSFTDCSLCGMSSYYLGREDQ